MFWKALSKANLLFFLQARCTRGRGGVSRSRLPVTSFLLADSWWRLDGGAAQECSWGRSVVWKVGFLSATQLVLCVLSHELVC